MAIQPVTHAAPPSAPPQAPAPPSLPDPGTPPSGVKPPPLTSPNDPLGRLRETILELKKMIEALRLGTRPNITPEVAPTVKAGEVVGKLFPTQIGPTYSSKDQSLVIHVEDVVGAATSEKEALRMAREYSASHGGEPVAIVATGVEDVWKQRAAQAAGNNPFGIGAPPPPGTKPVYNIVTLDPAIAPEHAHEIGWANTSPVSINDPSILWTVDDRTQRPTSGYSQLIPGTPPNEYYMPISEPCPPSPEVPVVQPTAPAKTDPFQGILAALAGVTESIRGLRDAQTAPHSAP